MSKVTVKAKSIEEAIKLALDQLQTSKEFVNIRVIDVPTKGFFGIGAKPAVVEVEMKELQSKVNEAKDSSSSIEEEININDNSNQSLEKAQIFLEEVLEQMDLDVTLNVSQREGTILITIKGTKLGKIIGRRGQTLDALQYLTNIVANRYSNQYLRIILDAENYRQRRQQTLEQLADRLAKKVIRTGNKVILEPMNPAERKIIHTFLQDYAGVVTKSEGEEPNRKVTLYPK